MDGGPAERPAARTRGSRRLSRDSTFGSWSPANYRICGPGDCGWPFGRRPVGADHAVLVGSRPIYVAQVIVAAGPVPAPGGSLHPVAPVRLLDTRSGLGAPAGATQAITLQITGRLGIPVTGVAAVALNVTVTAPAGGGFVTAYPAGQARPTVSNVNFSAGQTIANLVVVPVGVGGKIELYASVATQLIADAAGWFSSAATASPAVGLFHGVAPTRLADSRLGFGGSTPGVGGQLDLQVTGEGGVPSTGVAAVLLNTTVAGPTATGYVTACPSGTTRPVASTLNFTAGQTVANRVIVPVGADGGVSFYNPAGSTPLVIDVTGWFSDGSEPSSGGAYFNGVPPRRVVDTRIGLGAPKNPVGGGVSLPVVEAGQAGLPAANAAAPPTAVIANVTAIKPTLSGYLTVYPSLTSRPTSSDLNFTAGKIIPNLTVGPIGVDGQQLIYNSSGATDIIVDVSGYFVGDTVAPSTTHDIAPALVNEVVGVLGGTQEITLAGGAPVPPIGDVVAISAGSDTPDGLLGEVTAHGTNSSGDPVVTIEPASLRQAIGSGHFAVSAPLDGSDLAPVSPTLGAPPATLTPEILRRRLVANVMQTAINQPINKLLSCSTGGSVTITGSVGVTPTVNLSVDWGWFSMNSVTFTGTLSEDASLTASAHAATGCSVGPVPLLAQPIRFKPITFNIGPVPVVVTPTLQFYLSAEGSVTADISAGVAQHASGTLGVSWSDGSLRPIAQTSTRLPKPVAALLTPPPTRRSRPPYQR